MPNNNIIDEVTNLCNNEVSAAACIASAIAKEGGAWNRMTDSEKVQYCKMAANIEQIILQADEPRFSLYDYLDSIMHHRDIPWLTTAIEINIAADGTDDQVNQITDRIIKMAEETRKIYSNEF